LYHGEDHERVHPSFKQIGAPTGRFSCFNPNVQQIPAGQIVIDGIKHVVRFRETFDFPKGFKGVNADYSQIELRIAADQSGDRNMIETFESGRDLHADTASKVFNVPYELCAQDGHEYYNTYRKYSKSINFGIVYGMGANSLSAQINVSVEEAQEMIDKYAEAYPQLWEYLQRQKKNAIRNLAVRTASGRLQEFQAPSKDLDEDEIRKQNSAIGRNGMNMPIQGTSADILKRALKLLDDALEPYEAWIVNIVHDEIMVEAREDENLETVRKLTEDCMIAAAKEFVTKVPIKVDAKLVDNWSDK
jgi:DNA polymerase-1